MLYVYDVIDSWYGVSAKQVADTLASFDGADITVRVNSPGGDVFEARAIATLLREYSGAVDIHVDGLAASAASYIAISGDKTTVAKGAMVMIHNAWAVGMGNKHDLAELGKVLDQIDQSLAADYAEKSNGKTAADFLAFMDATTWFTAEDAVENGLADAVSNPKRGKAGKDDQDGATEEPSALIARFDDTLLPKVPTAVAKAIAKARAKPKPVVIEASDQFAARRQMNINRLRLAAACGGCEVVTA